MPFTDTGLLGIGCDCSLKQEHERPQGYRECLAGSTQGDAEDEPAQSHMAIATAAVIAPALHPPWRATRRTGSVGIGQRAGRPKCVALVEPSAGLSLLGQCGRADTAT